MGEVGEVSHSIDRTILHIDLDAFFVSVEQVRNPELCGKPVVVGGRPGSRGVVASASYEARVFGLRSGMALKTAIRLCPQAVFIEGNYRHYRDASEKFMAILADYSPFMEPMGIDEAYLDVTGFESLHGSIHQMAVVMKKRIKDELGLAASVGIANCKIVAKVASEQSKPDGLIGVPKGGERAFLAPLAVGKLPGIGEKTEQALVKLGIKTIGQLAAMPLTALKSRFGIYGDFLHQSANGIGSSEIASRGPVKSISRSTTFEKDTRNRGFLKATLRYLGEKVGAELREQGKLARCISIKVRYADFETITRSHTLPQATDFDQAIFDAGASLLNQALSTDKRPVRLIGIGVANLTESGRQLNMLDPSEGRSEKLDRAIDRIRQKYGFTAIQTGRTLLLQDVYGETDEGYALHTPSLSR